MRLTRVPSVPMVICKVGAAWPLSVSESSKPVFSPIWCATSCMPQFRRDSANTRKPKWLASTPKPARIYSAKLSNDNTLACLSNVVDSKSISWVRKLKPANS